MTEANRTEEQRWNLIPARVAELQERVDKLLSTLNVHECIAMRDMLSEALVTHKNVTQRASPKLYREYEMVTGGTDCEVDAIGVCLTVLRGLSGDEVRGILAYLSGRFSKRG
jgi:hypothetical protein